MTVTMSANAQNTIEWDGKYQLKLSDFQSSATQIGTTNLYTLMSASAMNFSFYMSNYEFMFTKNFNTKVNTIFTRNASSLVAPDSLIAQQLLSFAQFQFDMAELYARKFRKKIYEEKRAFSNVNFLKPLYDEVQVEYTERHTKAVKQTDIGRNGEQLIALHQAVSTEIEQLSEFCKTCKPQKKKK